MQKVFSGTEEKVGHAPLYAIGDNDSKLAKAVDEQGYIHIRDIGHTMALHIEHVYKACADFKEFIKTLSDVKIRESMRRTSCLLPPRQRSIARWMNLSPVVKWAKTMLATFPSLNEQEQETFGFVNTCYSLIEELDCVFQTVNTLLKEIKNKGLTHKNIDWCLLQTAEGLNMDSPRVKQAGENPVQYLNEERSKLPDAQTCWHASSDIIESLFGKYKFRRSKNSLNGVTAYVLLMPLLTKTEAPEAPSQVDFKASLENVFMKDLTHWSKNNLTENLAIKRKHKMAG
jgi:hypothetical protein